MLLFENAIREDNYVLDLDLATYNEAIAHAVKFIFSKKPGSEEAQAQLITTLCSTDCTVGGGVAIPYAYSDTIKDPAIVFVRLKRSVRVPSPDHRPVQYICLMFGPRESAADHLSTLAAVVRLFSNSHFRREVAKAKDGSEIMAAISNYYAEKAQMADDVDPPELKRTGILGGGILKDIRRRLPVYGADFRDGFNAKAIGSVLFLFFACLAPAVTFGGFMGIYTEGAIGVVEMITASAICGVIFAIFAGQPLIILGGTGPILVLTMILYQMCQDMGLPFLPTYCWVGLWTALFTILLAVTDASFLMKYFTRFTDEIFAGLISVIFIYEAIRSIVHIFTDHKVSYATALLSLLLALGTFYIASQLSAFRNSRFLYSRMREFIADFGPAIAIVVMTIVAVLMHEVDLEVLPAPDKFATTSGRSWWVNPLVAPTWIWFASALPALFVTVLVFLDQNITARLVNSPDHRLNRGAAYHLDLLVVGLLVGLCSFFGMPWLVAATVRSINHVRSLAKFDDSSSETSSSILEVRENRVTGLVIHLLVGGALLALPLIKMIPLAVLYGLFLYMGIVSMKGNQFFERLSLWPMDPKFYPATHYLRNVPKAVIHRFTLVQLAALAILWTVKASKLGILFPIFIAALVPLRLALGRYFQVHHLLALDAEELPEEENQRRVD